MASSSVDPTSDQDADTVEMSSQPLLDAKLRSNASETTTKPATASTTLDKQDGKCAGDARKSSRGSANIDHENKPLDSSTALLKLRECILEEVSLMKNDFSRRSLAYWLKVSISFRSELSKMRWPSVLFMTAQAVAHFIVAFVLQVDNLAADWVGVQGFILAFLLIVNLAVNLWDTQLRSKELLMKSEQLCDLIKRCAEDKHLIEHWKTASKRLANARGLFIPKSPCINQTLTYRDDTCVNVPDFLLVRGDIIHLYPGDRAPGKCVSLTTRPEIVAAAKNETDVSKEQQLEDDDWPVALTLHEGSILQVSSLKGKTNASPKTTISAQTTSVGSIVNSQVSSCFTDQKQPPPAVSGAANQQMKFRRAIRGRDFLMLSTPYIRSLRLSLQRSHKRPVNSIEKECFIISRKYFETYVIPSVFLLSTLVTAIHYVYLDFKDSDQQIKTMSVLHLLLRPSLTIMPFLPWMFPCFWMSVNAYGSARLICYAEAQRHKKLLADQQRQQQLRASKQLRRYHNDDDIDDDDDDEDENENENDEDASHRPSRHQAINQDDNNHASAAGNSAPSSKFIVNLLATPTAAGSSDQNKHDDDLHDLQSSIKLSEICRVFVDLICGRAGHVWRSSNLLQVLGCLTSLCCIDKVGILSWENLTPEKVFVLARNEDAAHVGDERQRELLEPVDAVAERSVTQQTSQDQEHHSLAPTLDDVKLMHHGCNDDAQLLTSTQHNAASTINGPNMVNTNATPTIGLSPCLSATHKFPSRAQPEVLDVSQTFHTFHGFNHEPITFKQASQLQFDDLNWRTHLSNLKPLGLCIVMNNCCEASFGDYNRFYKHISYETTERCNLTVVKRRCLCSLAKLIGFSSATRQSFKYMNSIGVYRRPDVWDFGGTTVACASRGKNRRRSQAASIAPMVAMTGGGGGGGNLSDASQSRLKLPFSNMICNIVQDSLTGSYQVFSQGTADVVLNACNEYWDGHQLVPLDDTLRKKAMDFYHRTSLTSYCSAFAYAPLLRRYQLDGHYIELPVGEELSQMQKLINEHHELMLFRQTILSPTTTVVQRQQTQRQISSTNVQLDAAVATAANMTISNLATFGSQLSAVGQDNTNLVSLCGTPIDEDINRPIGEHTQRHTHDCLLDPGQCNHQQSQKCSASLRHQQRVLRRYMSLESLCHLSTSNASQKVKQTPPLQMPLAISADKQHRSSTIHDAMDELNDQVFVGMVAMQYQACPDFVGLVEQLEHACIRFVHFSKENELRSRVFSEKMGLESGWNCHISLQSDSHAADGVGYDCSISSRAYREATFAEKSCPQQDKDTCKTEHSAAGTFRPFRRLSNLLFGPGYGNQYLQPSHVRSDSGCCAQDSTSFGDKVSLSGIIEPSDARTLYSWKSLPSLVMQIINKFSSSMASQTEHAAADAKRGTKVPDALLVDIELGGCDVDQSGSQHDDVQPTTAPDNDENIDAEFESLAFDMSNRAKLPKGIENIRPHLETVDNIPLQVSLFTDCTPQVTREMVEIMQDYGEIVCVIGSSSSRLNTSVFLQANASIAIEPMAPQTCLASLDDDDDGADYDCTRLQNLGLDASARKPAPSRDCQGEPKLSTSRKSTMDSVGGGSSTSCNSKRISLCGSESFLSLASSSSSSSSSSTSSSSPHPSSHSSSSTSSSSLSDAQESKLAGAGDITKPTRRVDINSSSQAADDHSSKRNSSHSSLLGDDTRSKLLMDLPDLSSLASKLAGLPCSYSYKRDEHVNLYGLIMEARHFTFKMKNTFVCMMCFALSISSAQFLASILFLPPMLSSGLTIWLCIVVVPLMSFSLMSTTIDSQVMKIAVGKNLQLKPENITFFVICYLIKFIPSIIVVVLSFGLIIAHSCKLTGFGSSSVGPCWMFTYVQHGNATSSETGSNEDLLWSAHLLTAQLCAAFLIVLYFVIISSGFVHRSHLIWERSPMKNGLWVVVSTTLIIGQIFYNHLVLQVNLGSSKIPYKFLASLPLHIWLISFISPILVVAVNLLVKRAEIKATIRQQRRARFDFNTKLGMNSPF